MTRLCLLDKIRTMKDYINFQTTFNIFGTLFILLTSTGLWSCMKEIERLKFSTNIVLDSIESPQDIGIHEQNIKVNSNYLFANKEGFKERILKKRAAYPVDLNSNLKNYDPLTADIKDTEDYCWSLIYNRCGGSVPGAPAVGPPGPPGPPGNPGLPGRVGPMGHMGPPGLNGLKGQKGDKGYLGEIGEPGADGPRGPPGIPGTPGIQGTNGRRGKRGLPGRPGKPGENGLRGLPGQKGQKGEKGDTGAVIGPGGNCTCKGIKGDKGVRGLVGFDGYKGEPGEKGEKGDGMIGFTGTKGEPGKKGEKGDPGFCTVNCGDKYVRRKVKEPQQRYYTKPEDPTSAPTEQYTAPSTPTTTTQRITTTTTTPSTPSTIPPTISPIYMACKIRQIGKPTLVRRDTSVYGTVLGDPVQPKKIWMLQGYHGQYLEEYSSMLNFKNKNVDKTYNLQYNRFYGTQHAIYNNSLYYHFVGKQFIVRYDLNILDVTSAAQIAGSNYNNSYYLYKDSKTYYDITADENGLWVVYGKVREGASMMNIMKLDLMTLTVVKVWKLPIETGVYGNGFIACGILYLVQNTHSQRAQVNYTYDMYNDIETKVNIPIVIPFKFNTMFTFFTNTSNRKHSRLFGWDNGYVLKYPLRF